MDTDSVIAIVLVASVCSVAAVVLCVGVLAVVYRVRRLRVATRVLADSGARITSDPNGGRVVVIRTSATARFPIGSRMPLLGRIARADEVMIGPNGVDHHAFHLLRANRRAFVSFADVVEVDLPDGIGAYVFALRLVDGDDLGFVTSEAGVDAALLELSRSCRLTLRARQRLHARGIVPMS